MLGKLLLNLTSYLICELFPYFAKHDLRLVIVCTDASFICRPLLLISMLDVAKVAVFIIAPGRLRPYLVHISSWLSAIGSTTMWRP